MCMDFKMLKVNHFFRHTRMDVTFAEKPYDDVASERKMGEGWPIETWHKAHPRRVVIARVIASTPPQRLR